MVILMKLFRTLWGGLYSWVRVPLELDARETSHLKIHLLYDEVGKNVVPKSSRKVAESVFGQRRPVNVLEIVVDWF